MQRKENLDQKDLLVNKELRESQVFLDHLELTESPEKTEKMAPTELMDSQERMVLREKLEPREKLELQATTEIRDLLVREANLDKRDLPESRDRRDNKVRTEPRGSVDPREFANLMTTILATVTPTQSSDILRAPTLLTAQLTTNHSGLDTRLSSSRATDMVFLKTLEVQVLAWRNSS